MENQRIRLSKALLKNALLDLLQTKPLSKISVLEICESAQINRTTFYKYYGSQTDLLDEIEADFLNQTNEQLVLVLKESPNAVATILESLYEQRSTFCTLVKAIPGQAFANHFFALPSISAIFENLAVTKGYSDQQAKYVREFIFQGVFAVLCDWLSSENPEPVSEIAETLWLLRERLI